ncbi:hypothetical protein [Enemella sp. A6]|uniref:hypothetical protein n=1 Tax=Enemella sp. A6 TaxID=3440152 RepID=UPI003EBD1E6A
MSHHADRYTRLDRVRPHSPLSLRTMRKATSAPERRQGLAAPRVPRYIARRIPYWPGQEQMLDLVKQLATHATVRSICRAHQVSVTTFLAVVTNDILDADVITGRGMRTSLPVAAARIGRGERQVTRARRVAVAIGIYLEVFRGRELTYEERRMLTQHRPGHGQRGLPSEYWITPLSPKLRRRITEPEPGQILTLVENPGITHPHQQRFVTLPLRGKESLHTYVLSILRKAAGAAQNERPPAAHQQKRRRRPDLAFSERVMRHEGLQRLFANWTTYQAAAQLRDYLKAGWLPHALGDAIDEQITRRGIRRTGPAHHPWSLLQACLQEIPIDPDEWVPAGPMFELAQPCGRCYGGWHIDHGGGFTTVEPCPTCDPGVLLRRDAYGNTWHIDPPDKHQVAGWEPWDGEGECPF